MSLKLLLAASVIVTGALLVGAFVLSGEEATEEMSSGEHVAGVSNLVYPTSLVQEIAQPQDDAWVLPAAATSVGGATFVLDTGNDRVLKLDQGGRVLATLNLASSGGLDVRQPMAIASDGGRLFVANSLAAEVLVMDLSGQVEKVLALPSVAGGSTPRPIGVAAMPGGGVVVSDADNHRVVRLDSEGRVVWSAGTGARAGGAEGFNVPGGVTVDSTGNIYVVDVLNGRVVKLSSDGVFLRQFGEFGDSVGKLARPKGVAVDGAGRVFVSDGLQVALQVFAPDGAYLGFIARRDPADPGSASLFQAPAGLSLNGDQLLVTDRLGGVITLRLADQPAAEPAAVEGEGD